MVGHRLQFLPRLYAGSSARHPVRFVQNAVWRAAWTSLPPPLDLFVFSSPLPLFMYCAFTAILLPVLPTRVYPMLWSRCAEYGHMASDRGSLLLLVGAHEPQVHLFSVYPERLTGMFAVRLLK